MAGYLKPHTTLLSGNWGGVLAASGKAPRTRGCGWPRLRRHILCRSPLGAVPYVEIGVSWLLRHHQQKVAPLGLRCQPAVVGRLHAPTSCVPAAIAPPRRSLSYRKVEHQRVV